MRSLYTKWLPLLVFLLIIGGVGYLAMLDVPVQQTQIEKTIPNSQFFQ